MKSKQQKNIPIIKRPSYKSYVGAGSYGIYYKLSKNVGLKLIDGDFKDVEQEFNNLVKAHSLLKNMVPKPIEIVFVQDKREGLIPAIKMEHIDGFNLFDKIDEIDKALSKKGVSHGDLHEGNILYTGDPERPIVIIDWSFADFRKKKKKKVAAKKKVKKRAKKK